MIEEYKVIRSIKYSDSFLNIDTVYFERMVYQIHPKELETKNMHIHTGEDAVQIVQTLKQLWVVSDDKDSVLNIMTP